MKNIKTNSKLVEEGDIFICTHNSLSDKHDYIEDAIKKKASLIIVDKDIDIKTDIPIIKVKNTNTALYHIASIIYDNPYDKLNLIGITGTDGKTTTATIIKELLSKFSKTSYLGTNGFSIDEINLPTANTTPNLEEIIKYMAKTNELDGNNLVTEVSSEALYYDRCQKLEFDRAILTNVTGDHLNTHKTFANYLESKTKLFEKVKKDGINILNIDDKYFNYFKDKCSSNVISYGKDEKADYRITNLKLYPNKTSFDLIKKAKLYHIETNLKGEFNAYNLTSALALIDSYNIDLDEVTKYLKDLKQVAGRVEFLDYQQDYKIVIDYAHTKNGLLQMYKYLKSIKEGKVITVIGCAGGREKEKRKDIGKIASDNSDIVIFTMDDPRNEDLDDIINSMLTSVTKDNYLIIKDRQEAIFKALNMANNNDIVFIAGKGRDNYMAIKDEKINYSDFEVVDKYYRKKSL